MKATVNMTDVANLCHICRIISLPTGGLKNVRITKSSNYEADFMSLEETDQTNLFGLAKFELHILRWNNRLCFKFLNSCPSAYQEAKNEATFEIKSLSA